MQLRHVLLVFLLCLFNLSQADRRPPKSAHPRFPLPRRLVLSGTAGLAGGLCGAIVIGKRFDSTTIQVVVGTAVGSCLGTASVLYREEILQCCLRFVKFLLHRENLIKNETAYLETTATKKEKQSRWPDLKSLQQVQKDDDGVEKKRPADKASSTTASSTTAPSRTKDVRGTLSASPTTTKESAKPVKSRKMADIKVNYVAPRKQQEARALPNIAFWRKKEEDPSTDDEKPYSPPWSNVNKEGKNYVEKW